MIDNNCTMCTIGHFLGTDSYGAANATDSMDGPAYNAQEVSQKLIDCGLSMDGDYQGFDTIDAAEQYMLGQGSTRFAFAYDNTPLGHMLCAFRAAGMIIYRDYQPGGWANSIPRNATRYYVWPVN